ncbi:glycosyltransferase [Edwardsiella tarda]|uniref:glycosyltransferase family 2 protein n=1 Tax=Edwardsiella tarda TaxID=636 RepID=UPI00351C8592
MTDDLLLSIIIPFYNIEQYVVDCLDSLRKSIPDNVSEKIEIIIINDGSTDRTLDIINTYDWDSIQASIKVIDQINGGLSAARNAGLDIAKGKYIAFLDGDDVFLPEVTGLLSSLDLIESDIIEINSVRFHSLSCVNGEHVVFPYLRHDGFVPNRDIDIYKESVFSACVWMVWGRFFKRSLIGDDRFPEGKTYEDIIFTSDLYKKSNIIYVYNKICIGYRYNLMSITSRPRTIDFHSMEWVFLQAYDRYIETSDVKDFFLLSNSFIFFVNIMNGVMKLSLNDYNNIRREIISSIYFYRLPLLTKIKIKHPYIFFMLKNLYNKIKRISRD